MKRCFFFCVGLLVILLAGCSSSGIKDEYAHYRNKTSAEIYAQAKVDLDKKRYAKAAEELDALDAIYPFGPNSKQAQLDLIYANYQNGDLTSALTSAERYIRLYPGNQYTDYAYYMKGCIEFSQGLNWLQKKFRTNPASGNLDDKKEAFGTFETLIQLYPNSVYAKDAQLRMRYLRNVFADKELLVADFYYQQKAYVAAANRASEVVKHYDGTTSVKPALVLLVKSYRQLNLTTQANNTLKILQANYPDAMSQLS